MLQFVRTRLELKILLLVILVLATGFGTYVVITTQRESEALLAQQREKLRVATESLSAGIRNVMLTGKATFAVEMVNDFRRSVKFVDVTVYDRFGREAFLREGEGIDRTVRDSAVASVVRTLGGRTSTFPTDTGAVVRRYEPLVNRPECWRCHDPKTPLRGVLELGVRPGAVLAGSMNDDEVRVATAVGSTIATAFRTIMLGGNGDQMDTLVAAASLVPGVRLVQVYDRLGFLHFGPEDTEVPEERIADILRPRTADPVFEQNGPVVRGFFPLVNEERCQVCHGAKFPMRGALVMEFDRPMLSGLARGTDERLTMALQKAVVEGFRSIMLVGRAGCARFYMDELRSIPAFQTVRVFDADGFERFLNPPPRSREQIANVVAGQDTLEFMEGSGAGERLVRVVPLPNEQRCHACHGSTHRVRGAVEVSASMGEINARVAGNRVRSAVAGAATILLVWLVIRLFMRRVVVQPVQEIARVADRVGSGDFSARTDVRTSDEIGTLGRRINDMVSGLRERFHLAKFVSQQTVDAVRRSEVGGVMLGGERKMATVFFSDIRGFTSFAERTEPEEVVAMLNAILSGQAAIVRRHEGDVDKYVGDELVAVFEGPGMAERAVRAALEIQRNLPALVAARGRGDIAIGVGINTGEMVMGAMGSPERMDYTVIGDNVNLGARLCSAAAPGQILVAKATADLLANAGWCVCRELDPMTLKGKQAPVRVYEVEERASQT